MAHDPLPTHGSQSPALKRRTYIVGTALGVALCVLYAFSTIHEGVNAAFAVSMAIMIELTIFFCLFVFAAQWMETLEVIFYAMIVASLLLLGEVQIQVLYAKGVLTPDKLGFLINSLVLWLTICLLGAFLGLPLHQVRRLLLLIWVGMALIATSAALVMRPPEEWHYSFLVSWVAGIVTLCIVSLQLNWLGQRQQRLATTDALTGVANRHVLSEMLAQHYARAVAQRHDFAVLMIDVDFLKSINDRFGHARGDQALQETAAGILSQIRGSDLVGRWGGDEFLVLLTDMGLVSAQQVAERIRATLELRGISVSIGVHAYLAGQSIGDALSSADQALYAAKQAGRNQVSLSSHL
jgi:diguanylate cyclase (GGDEF)-like protein